MPLVVPLGSALVLAAFAKQLDYPASLSLKLTLGLLEVDSHFQDKQVTLDKSSTLFIDCTISGVSENVSGIPRVVRQIITNSVPPPEGSRFNDCQTVGVAEQRFRRYQMKPPCPPPRPLTRHVRNSISSLATWLKQRFPRSHQFLKTIALGLGAGRLLGERMETPSEKNAHVNFQAGDALLLADALWMVSDWKPAVEQAKAGGARVATVIYDLIPITHPQFFTPDFSENFKAWIREVVPLTDLFLCISRATATELERFCLGNGLALDKPVRVFRLGTSFFEGPEAPTGRIKRVVDALDRPVLMVGTIEPRKNHDLALDAFEKCWQRGCKLSLLVIGRPGWLCGPVLKRFKRLSRAGYPIVHLDDVLDGELSYCYRHARCLVFPSITEGFGLPLAEALAKGLPVIASDIPIHREIGGELPVYFPLEDASHLAGLLEGIGTGEVNLTTRTANRAFVHSWKDSALEIERHLTDTLFG